MFVQGKRPALLVPVSRLEAFRARMRRAGYRPHLGHRVQRSGELGAWTRSLPSDRHVHVQEVAWSKSSVAVFAHTEPAGGLRHVWSALTDGANFPAGARTLRQDLRAAGWR